MNVSAVYILTSLAFTWNFSAELVRSFYKGLLLFFRGVLTQTEQNYSPSVSDANGNSWLWVNHRCDTPAWRRSNISDLTSQSAGKPEKRNEE